MTSYWELHHHPARSLRAARPHCRHQISLTEIYAQFKRIKRFAIYRDMKLALAKGEREEETQTETERGRERERETEEEGKSHRWIAYKVAGKKVARNWEN